MADFLELPSWDEQGRLRVVVETPRGSGFKLKYDPATRAFAFQRPLEGLHYPHDWGFISGTLAEDGDPLDALVLHDDVTWPGIVIPSEPIALLKIRDQKADAEQELENDRVIAVPFVRRSGTVALQAEKRHALEQFFRAAAERTKHVRVVGWGDADEARAAIQRARAR
ncbi:MAG TPA: inorganic diphosphatase [Polyangiaceae bacterium]|nr:inorganic diphosphatase [Polyangiaceae bacterium]